MKKIILLAALCLTFSVLRGQTFKSVDVETFAKAVSDTTYVVLDVRTEAEHTQGHIPGTHLNIDVLKDNFGSLATELIPEGKKVALYCRSGNRSKNAAKILTKKGYEVVELATGYRGWSSKYTEKSSQ